MIVTEDNTMKIFNRNPKKSIVPGLFDSPNYINELHKLRDKVNELYIKYEDNYLTVSGTYSKTILDCLEIIDKHIEQVERKKGKR